MSKALYRKHRSKTLDEVVGQSHITSILSQSLKKGRIAHAYLLTGPRGVGKTSIARILAHEINQLPYTDEATHLDIIEIDAASNNGVDDVRELREKAQIAPVSATKKIYIIDEVHMLSKAAFNALLKTLEEPPEHIVFILATTDVDKLPATIISRVQQFHFRAIQPDDAATHLRKIADEEQIKITDEALLIVAERGRGSFRDSISMLDQLAGLTDNETITRTEVEQVLGLAPQELIDALIAAYQQRDVSAIIQQLTRSEDDGTSAKLLTQQIIQKVRRTIADNPELIHLLDQLIDVERSAHPDIKLLTVLAKPHIASQQSPVSDKPKTVAHIAQPQPTISAKPAELQKKTAPRSTTQVTTRPTAPREPAIAPEVQSTAARPTVALESLDWAALIETARENFVAVYSVLCKCSYELKDGELIIYAGSAFYKKKLDDPKHRINIAKALEMNGHPDVSIEIIATPMPPKDSTLAAIAGIMGGGEEVSLEEQPA